MSSPPSLYSLLDNNDVLLEIFGHLHRSRPALMNSALVCKAFSHAALDILWEEVEDFLHLLKTIGPNLAQDSPSHYILRGCILQARWERFYSYASRIRVLHVGEHETKYTISTSVYDRLTFQARHRRLFPSLVDLHWKARRAVGSCLLTFITPSLRRVRVTYELKTRTGERATPDHSFRDALYVLGSEAPLFLNWNYLEMSATRGRCPLSPILRFSRICESWVTFRHLQ
ncbi:hypothetical protein BKA93DRAFT_318706 [Sparassis latifolia]